MSRSLKTKQSFDETNVQGFYKEAKYMQVERNFLTPNACIHRKKLSGGRVSNTWVTCLKEGDNTWKQVLIPYISKDRMILR